jgi:uncharacterized protein YecE (DUF72 family)
MVSLMPALLEHGPGLLHVGTSGWSYPHWRGIFYPPDLPSSQWLSYYSRHFHTVEINSSFYRLPTMERFAEWRDSVPEGFLFAVKASRYITHMKKLQDVQDALGRFLEHAGALRDKLGPILFQLPPRWGVNSQRLAEFLGSLPGGYCYAMEFRDPSWFSSEVQAILEKHSVAFCISDIDTSPSPLVVSSQLVYIRLHGPVVSYTGRYGEKDLRSWSDNIGRWVAQGRQVFCYFDNDQAGFAVHDAQRLLALRHMP